MSNVKRVGIVLLVGLIVAVLSTSFSGRQVLDRAIIIGIGIDAVDDDCVVTAEVINAGGGSEQVGTYSKVVTSRGKSVTEALRLIHEMTGKETSLGQCTLLVIGDSYFDRDSIVNELDYFAFSDSFKESATVCCCGGSAKDLLNTHMPLASSVSLALSNLLRDVTTNIGVPNVNILTFCRSQLEGGKCGYVNYVTVLQDDSPANEDSNYSQQGYFACNGVAVFRNFGYVTTMTGDALKGFALINPDVTGNMFVVSNDAVTEELPPVVTVRANGKSCNTQVDKDNMQVTLDVTLSVKQAKTDSSGTSGVLGAKTTVELPKCVLDEVTLIAREQIDSFVRFVTQYNVDVFGVYGMFHAKYGSSFKEMWKTVAMDDFNYEVKVNTEED